MIAEGAALTKLMAALLVWVAAAMGYPDRVALPTIAFVPESRLNAMLCPSGRCSLAGVYISPGAIYLLEGLDPLTDTCARAVLAHELAHHFQYVSGRFANHDLRVQRMAEESEAVLVQNIYLAEHGRFGRC